MRATSAASSPSLLSSGVRLQLSRDPARRLARSLATAAFLVVPESHAGAEAAALEAMHGEGVADGDAEAEALPLEGPSTIGVA